MGPVLSLDYVHVLIDEREGGREREGERRRKRDAYKYIHVQCT